MNADQKDFTADQKPIDDDFARAIRDELGEIDSSMLPNLVTYHNSRNFSTEKQTNETTENEICIDQKTLTLTNLLTQEQSKKPKKSRAKSPLIQENTNSDPVVAPVGQLVFTKITSYKPDRMTKIIGLDSNGRMDKKPTAEMTDGKAEHVSVSTLENLREVLDALKSNEATTWGVNEAELVRICTAADVTAQDRDGAVPRTAANFKYATIPGLLMIDHDGLPDGELTRDQFRDRLIQAIPSFAGVPMLWRPSASAGCIHPDGNVLSGLTRHRFYIPVTNAAQIPDAGKTIERLLWARGEGWCIVGAAGQALMRCLVDTSVWQGNKLDFSGQPILVNGITRPNAEGVIYGDPAAQVDLSVLISESTEAIKKLADAAKKLARQNIADECKAQRDKWVLEHAPRVAERQKISVTKATALLDRAADRHILMGEFELTTQTGQLVTVGQVLDSPTLWHGTPFADPLEPGNDRRVATAYLLNGDRPHIHSFAHGGTRYELRPQSARVEVGIGMRIQTTDALLEVLRERGELYDFGENAIAYVADGCARPVSRDWLLDHAGRAAEFYSKKIKRDDDGNIIGVFEYPADAPKQVIASILAKHGSRYFRKLTAVTTAPTLRPDGSIFDQPGYDEKTGLLYVTEEIKPPRVPVSPTPDDALEALKVLWEHIRLFPYVGDVDRGVTLAAMISACLRPSLPTCMAFGFDAPAAGTGKTFLAKCVGALATGDEVSILPPTNIDEECRKRLFAALRGGNKVILWDNVREQMGNAALDAFLTSSVFSDRVLNTSDIQHLPNRALFLVSGNNLVLIGDTHRRVLRARLDAQMEQPYKRAFLFSPVEETIRNRQKIVVAALTIVRAYIHAGRPIVAQGRTASFELWDDLVRQPVCWLKEIIKRKGRVDLPGIADPSLSIDQSGAENPETGKLRALTEAWLHAFSDNPATTADAIRRATDPEQADQNLYDALDDIAGQGSKINGRILGRWIERHQDQRCGGLRFCKQANMTGNRLHWIVSRSPERQTTDQIVSKLVKVSHFGTDSKTENEHSKDDVGFV